MYALMLKKSEDVRRQQMEADEALARQLQQQESGS